MSTPTPLPASRSSRPSFRRLTPDCVTVALELPGYRITRNLGIVRGVVVRSRSIIGNFVGGIHSLFGGNITVYTELCEQARKEAYEAMVHEAMRLGAHAVIGVRYDGADVMTGLAEVLCYGSAVWIEPLEASPSKPESSGPSVG